MRMFRQFIRFLLLENQAMKCLIIYFGWKQNTWDLQLIGSERNTSLKSLRILFSRRQSMGSEFSGSDSGSSHKEFTNDLRGLENGKTGSDSICTIIEKK